MTRPETLTPPRTQSDVMRLTPEMGPKSGLPGLVLVQFLVQSLPLPCLSFSRGASLSSCVRMVPGHVHAHPHDPALSHVTLHTSSTYYLPGHLLTVTVRSSRDFMGFLLQARSAARPGFPSQSPIQGRAQAGPSGAGPGALLLGGSWTLTPPGTHAVRCIADDDTATHSDKQLKRNLSFVWKAPDQPMGDVRFYITVVQSYFVYWTGIRSPVLHDGTRSRWRGNSMMQVQTFDDDSIQDNEEEIASAINATTKRAAKISVTTAYESKTRTQNKTTSTFLLNHRGITTANVKRKAKDENGPKDGGIGAFVRSERLFEDKASQTNTEDVDSDGLASIFSAMNESAVFPNDTRPSALILNDEQMGGKNANDATQDPIIRSNNVQTTLPKSYYTIWNETGDNTMRERVEMHGSLEQQPINNVQKPKLGTSTNTTLVQDSTSPTIHLEANPEESILHSSTQSPQTTSLNKIVDTKMRTTVSNLEASSATVSSTNQNSGDQLHFSNSTQNGTISQTEAAIVSSATDFGQDHLLQKKQTFSSSLSDVTETSNLQNQTFAKPNVDAQSEIEITPPTNKRSANQDELLVTSKSSPLKGIKDLLLHLDSLLAEDTTTTPNLTAASKVSQTFSNGNDLENITLVGSTSISVPSSATKITSESNYSTSSSISPTLNQVLTSTSPSTTRSTVSAPPSRHESISTSQESRSPSTNDSMSNLNQKVLNPPKLTTLPTSSSAVHSTTFASTSRQESMTQTTANALYLSTPTNFKLPISEHVTRLPVLRNPTLHRFKATTASQTSPIFTFVLPRSTTSRGTSQPSPLASTLTHSSTDLPYSSIHGLSTLRTATEPTHQYVRFPFGETSSVAPEDTTPDPKLTTDSTSTIAIDDVSLIYKSKPASRTLSTKVTSDVATSSIRNNEPILSTTSDQHLSTIANNLNQSAKTSETEIAPDVAKFPSYTPTALKFPKSASTVGFAHSKSSLGQNSSLKSINSYTTFSTIAPETSTSFTSSSSTVSKDSIVRTTHSTEFYQRFVTSFTDIAVALKNISIVNSTPNLASETYDNRSSRDSVHSLIAGLTQKPKTSEASKPATTGRIEQYNSSTKFTDISNTNKAIPGPLADNLRVLAAISNQKEALERENDPTRESFSGTPSFKLNSTRIRPSFSSVATNFHQKTVLEMSTITSKSQYGKELFKSKPSGSTSTTPDANSLAKSHDKLAIGENTERPTTANHGQLPNVKGSATDPKSQFSNQSSIYNINTRSSPVSESETPTSKKPIAFSSMETSDSKTSLAIEAKTTQPTTQYNSKLHYSVFTPLEVTTIAPTSSLINQTLSSKSTRQTPSRVSKSTINGRTTPINTRQTPTIVSNSSINARTTPINETNSSQSLAYVLNTGKSSSTMRSRSTNGLNGKNMTPTSSNANLYQKLVTDDEATTVVPLRRHTLPTTLNEKFSIMSKNATKVSPGSVFVNSSTRNYHPTFSSFSKMPTFVVTSQSQTPSNAPASTNLSKSPTIASLINNESATNTNDNERFTNLTKNSTIQHFPSVSGLLKNNTLTVVNFSKLLIPLPTSSPPSASPFFVAQTYATPKTSSSSSNYTSPDKSNSGRLKFKPSAARQSFLNHVPTFKPTLAQKTLIEAALPNYSAKPNPAISQISDNVHQNVKPKVEVKAKLPPNIHPDRGGKYPDIVPRHSAWELGMLLGCSAGLGMVLVVGIRYVHRKACGKRTQVTLHDREREYSRGERGLIHVQECGDLVRVRRIRENSFVLLAEYDILARPGD